MSKVYKDGTIRQATSSEENDISLWGGALLDLN